MQSTLSAVSESNRDAAICFLANSARKLPNLKPSVQCRTFGKLPGGEVVEAWILTGKGGIQLECISYGGVVTRLLVPDRSRRLADVVQGFGSLEPYMSGSACFGGIIGRVAGRIPGAQYRLNGYTYKLTGINSPNHPQEAAQGYNKRLWSGTILSRSDGAPSLRLTLTSEDGDEGHPGTVQISITYTVTNDNSFLVETEAVTDQLTPLSLAHSAYFNLAGESSGTIQDHELQIHSDECVAVDDQMTPLGRIEALVSPGNDFRRLKSLSATLPHVLQTHGELYRLRMSAAENVNIPISPAARLVHRSSGRVLDVSTSTRCLQLYTTPELGETLGKSGSRYGKHSGICLECEGYPGGISHPELGNILLRPGQVRREATAYSFSNVTDEGELPPFSWPGSTSALYPETTAGSESRNARSLWD